MKEARVPPFHQDYTKWLRMDPPDWINLNPYRETLTEEELSRVRKRLIDNPVELAYVSSMSQKDLEILFPGICAGAYLRDLSTISPSTSNTIRYFGVNDENDFYRQALTAISGSLFQLEIPQSAFFIHEVIDFVQESKKGEKRKTGEPGINHELRVTLRVLAEVFKTELFLHQLTPEIRRKMFDPMDQKHRKKSQLAINAIPLHDYKEDFNGKTSHTFRREKQIIILNCLSGNDTSIDFGNEQDAIFFEHVIKNLSNSDSNSSGSDLAYVLQLMLVALNPESDPVQAWITAVGKGADRSDNTQTLWSHNKQKLLAKLFENLFIYRPLMLQSWIYNRVYTPPVIAESLLLLLGADYVKLYEWIDKNKELKQFKATKDSCITIPHINHAVVITEDGIELMIKREGTRIEKGGYFIRIKNNAN